MIYSRHPAACEALDGASRLMEETNAATSDPATVLAPSRVTPSSAPGATPIADIDLISGAAAGDERAMAALYDRYGQVLYAVAYRILGRFLLGVAHRPGSK